MLQQLPPPPPGARWRRGGRGRGGSVDAAEPPPLEHAQPEEQPGGEKDPAVHRLTVDVFDQLAGFGLAVAGGDEGDRVGMRGVGDQMRLLRRLRPSSMPSGPE